MGPTQTATQRRPAAPAPRPHPRVSERRREVSRQMGRRRFVVLCFVAALVTLAALAWPLAHSRFFSARVVVVHGAHETPLVQVIATAGLSNAPPMIDVHAGAAQRALDALPWVRRATVSLEWPDGVRITLSERRAVCAVARGAGWVELDRTGRVLADVDNAPAGLVHAALPGALPAPGGTLGGGSSPALTVAATLPPLLRPDVALVEAGPGATVVLELVGGVDADLGGANQLGAKYEDVASIEAGAPPAAGSVIDVSVPQSPTVATS
jgi:cell division protein FtsQ